MTFSFRSILMKFNNRDWITRSEIINKQNHAIWLGWKLLEYKYSISLILQVKCHFIMIEFLHLNANIFSHQIQKWVFLTLIWLLMTKGLTWHWKRKQILWIKKQLNNVEAVIDCSLLNSFLNLLLEIWINRVFEKLSSIVLLFLNQTSVFVKFFLKFGQSVDSTL